MIEIHKIMEGCFTGRAEGEEPAMFGCPSESIKLFRRNGLNPPSIIVMPDPMFRAGINQADVEFNIFNTFYPPDGGATGKKLRLVGTEDQLRRLKIILQQKLFGPTSDQMREWKIDPAFVEWQSRITRHLNGAAFQTVEDAVELIPFDGNLRAQIGNYTVRMVDKNVFELIHRQDAVPFDLNFFQRQPPPLKIEVAHGYQLLRPAFGITALSKCASGFDPSGYTTGWIMWGNSMPLLVDGVPWINEHLGALGLNVNEIAGIIMSHTHGDHSSIYDLILSGQKANLITPKEIFLSFVEITAALINRDKEWVKSMINFHEVTPGKPFHWFGVDFNFFRTIHTIPAIGFSARRAKRTIVSSGDTVWGQEKLERLRSAGLIERKQYEKIYNIPFQDADAIVIDLGGGMIHGDPVELMTATDENQAERICVTHCKELPSGSNFIQMQPGFMRIFSHAEEIEVGNIIAIENAPFLAGIDKKWRYAIFNSSATRNVSKGEIILEEGGAGRDFYLILSGECEVIHEGRIIARLRTGDFFGEASLINHVPCNATVKSCREGSLLEVPKNLFLEMAKQTDLGRRLRQINRKRPVILGLNMTRYLPTEIVNALATLFQERSFRTGETIFKQGEKGDEMFLIQSGRVDVIKNDDQPDREYIATVYPSQIFGEMAILAEEGVRSASVIAKEDTVALVVQRAELEKIVQNTPILSFIIGNIAAEREEENLY